MTGGRTEHDSNPMVSAAARVLQRRGRVYALVALLLLLVVVIVLAVSIGSTGIPMATTAKILASKLPFVSISPTWPAPIQTAILDVRLPRVILAAIAGAALSVAGATYQGLFRNPLADPYLIGVAQGAGLGAVIGFMLHLGWGGWGLSVVSLLALVGGLGAAFFTYYLGRVGRTLPMTSLILAGVALGSFLLAITSFLMLTSGESLHGIYSWLMGGFSSPRWIQVEVMLPFVSLGVVFICLYGQKLNVMQLDEEQAQQLGINVERTKRLLLLAATLITAAAVCFGGVIGFVGIIIPHAVRLIWGPDYRFLLPLATVAGSIFLVLADLLARTALAPQEIPLGIITAFFGAPFFLYLLRQRRRAIF
ncbi:MAG: iron chelate uptake ABC transporter family permease subunit [Chloroflexi bacterium]|nr:iron chelate uptake ABC transporter family permease subunit [Chloroflexota bacterium]